MDKFRIDGFSDDSLINGIGSLFRRADGSRWYINLSTSPVKSERSYLTLSQSPVLARQRILNSKTEISKVGYHKSFTPTRPRRPGRSRAPGSAARVRGAGRQTPAAPRSAPRATCRRVA